MTKYKLCKVETEGKSYVYPLNNDGEEITTAYMLDYDNCEDNYYAIFENISTDQFEDWELYKSFDNKEEAVKEFKKLLEEEK